MVKGKFEFDNGLVKISYKRSTLSHSENIEFLKAMRDNFQELIFEQNAKMRGQTKELEFNARINPDSLLGDISDLISVRLYNNLLNYLIGEHKIPPIEAHKLSVLDLSKTIRHRSFVRTRNVGAKSVVELNSIFIAAGLSIL